MARLYVLGSGIYSQRFIEALAMAGKMNIIQPKEVSDMLKTKKQSEVIEYMEGLIAAHAPAYRARRQSNA